MSPALFYPHHRGHRGHRDLKRSLFSVCQKQAHENEAGAKEEPQRYRLTKEEPGKDDGGDGVEADSSTGYSYLNISCANSWRLRRQVCHS